MRDLIQVVLLSSNALQTDIQRIQLLKEVKVMNSHFQRILIEFCPELGKILEVLVLEYDFRRTRTRTRRVSTRIRTHTRGI